MFQEVTPEKIPQSFQEFWKKDVRARRGKYSRLQDRVRINWLCPTFFAQLVCMLRVMRLAEEALEIRD